MSSVFRSLALALTLVVVVVYRRSRTSTTVSTQSAAPLFDPNAALPPQPPPPPFPGAALAALPSHAALFERAFFINADDSPYRRKFMEKQLQAAGVRYERWPALRGSPTLLKTHQRYFARGVEQHLYANRSFASGTIIQWGTVGTYLSHLTLFESILHRWADAADVRLAANASMPSFLILQDDTQMKPRWLRRLGDELRTHDAATRWQRLLLVWWGLERPADCKAHAGWCAVRPPAGPTDPSDGKECCGKRYYHGLQAWLVRLDALRCLVRRLRRRRIKNIDAQMVQCDCPRSFALSKRRMLGEHLDKELGSERAAVNSVWRANVDKSPLKRSAHRNLRKTRMEHLKGVAGG